MKGIHIINSCDLNDDNIACEYKIVKCNGK